MPAKRSPSRVCGSPSPPTSTGGPGDGGTRHPAGQDEVLDRERRLAEVVGEREPRSVRR